MNVDLSQGICWQVGNETDIGGGRENQDAMFIYEKKELKLCIVCVLDGHGKEVGRVASFSGKDYFIKFFDTHLEEFISSPYDTLVKAFLGAHEHIKSVFKKQFESQGFEVLEESQGYLVKRKAGTNTPWSCIHGGTSCSLVAFVKNKIYLANVGDSSGILCSKSLILDTPLIAYLGDSALAPAPNANKNEGKATSMENIPPIPTHNSTTIPPSNPSDTLVLFPDHSPECPSEFLRMRSFRPNPTDPRVPEMLMLYDAPSHDKAKCPKIFELNNNNIPMVTNKGKYYKNVRQEWASLVSTPSTARFQDALAFTRSLGDFHLHAYGVSQYPEIQVIDVVSLLKNLTSEYPTEPTILSLVLCSDGVWDNFLFPDVTRFVMDPSCIGAVRQDLRGAQRVATSFMQRNMSRSRSNFGSSADNATCIIMYITSASSPAFPTDGFTLPSTTTISSDNHHPVTSIARSNTNNTLEQSNANSTTVH